jgi:tetratricopeptide (TPR) repeat protein
MPSKRKKPSRFAFLREQSRWFWIKLAIIAPLTIWLAWLSFIHAVANVTWQQNPDLALSYVPDHPLALSRKADELFAEKQDPATLAKVEAMAKESLRGGALNPVAIRLLGYVADARGDEKRARELMLLSHRVSRRDFGTQLWLIEDAVARGDKKQALYHYDIAMRTTPSSHELLFSTLVGALSDPEVRRYLAPHVAKNPQWLPAFFGYAISNSENPANLADLLVKSGNLPDEDVFRNLSNGLLEQLIAKNKLAAYRQYYLSLHGTRETTLRTAAMTSATVNLPYPAAGWRLVDHPAIGGQFSPSGTNGRFVLSGFAGSGERGELMRKILNLKPGDYRFAARYRVAETAPDANVGWSLLCLPSANPTPRWTVDSPVRAGPGQSVLDFTIGSDCPFQILQLNVAGGSGQLGAEFTLSSVDIAPRS